MQSLPYQKRVVACAVDEAHCISMWGQDFRKQFGELAVLKSYIDNLQFLAVTSTKSKARELSITLCSRKLKIVSVSLNRKIIKISTKTQFGFDGVKDILLLIAKRSMIKKGFSYHDNLYETEFRGKAYHFFDKHLSMRQRAMC